MRVTLRPANQTPLDLNASSGTRKRPGRRDHGRVQRLQTRRAHRITLTGHQVDDGRPLVGGEHAPRPAPPLLPPTGPRPWATAARGTAMIECIGPGRDAIELPPRAAEPRSGSTPKAQPHDKKTALTERQSKARAGEVLRISDPVTGSSQGSETGEQRCAQPRATASNRSIDEPSDSQTCTSEAWVAFRQCYSRDVSASLTRKRSLVQSQYRPLATSQLKAGHSLCLHRRPLPVRDLPGDHVRLPR